MKINFIVILFLLRGIGAVDESPNLFLNAIDLEIYLRRMYKSLDVNILKLIEHKILNRDIDEEYMKLLREIEGLKRNIKSINDQIIEANLTLTDRISEQMEEYSNFMGGNKEIKVTEKPIDSRRARRNRSRKLRRIRNRNKKESPWSAEGQKRSKAELKVDFKPKGIVDVLEVTPVLESKTEGEEPKGRPVEEEVVKNSQGDEKNKGLEDKGDTQVDNKEDENKSVEVKENDNKPVEGKEEDLEAKKGQEGVVEEIRKAKGEEEVHEEEVSPGDSTAEAKSGDVEEEKNNSYLIDYEIMYLYKNALETQRKFMESNLNMKFTVLLLLNIEFNRDLDHETIFILNHRRININWQMYTKRLELYMNGTVPWQGLERRDKIEIAREAKRIIADYDGLIRQYEKMVEALK